LLTQLISFSQNSQPIVNKQFFKFLTARLSSSAEESVHLIAEGSAQPSKRQRPKSPEQQQVIYVLLLISFKLSC